MAQLPKTVSSAWEKMDGPVVFTTVNKNGEPNSIYATCISKFSEEYLLIADNYFSKTRDNIKSGSLGSLLFITDEKKSFQVKGTIEYLTEGLMFDDMKKWNPEKHPGHAVAALNVKEVYSGSEKLL